VKQKNAYELYTIGYELEFAEEAEHSVH